MIYDRADSAVCDLGSDDIDWALIADAEIIHLTGITPALSPRLADAVTAVATAVAASDSLLSVDVNYRAKLWSPEAAAESLTPLLHLADIVVCGRQDARELFAIDGEPDAVAGSLSERFEIESVVVTDGARGGSWRNDGAEGSIESLPVTVIDRLGAGDAFTAGLIDGILDGDFAAGVSRGVALAAIALTTHGDRGHATRRDMLDLMGDAGRDVDR